MSDPHDHARDVLDGRYRLRERLGRGGMADVFRADDLVLGREVAVKIVRSGGDGVAADERARSEVSALAALNHPSLVTLYDAHIEDGSISLVMEVVEGPTLSARLATSPLAPAAVAEMAADLGEALHVVHEAGIVHRDVKPSNVLLAPSPLPGGEPRAKLADFGIAYLVDTARVTTPGEVIGTAAYLAPEQVRGEEPAPPADVYALGLVLIEALSGQRAFPEAAGVATALARLSEPPRIPDTLGPAWVDLLTRMTGIDPAGRPTAREVAVTARTLGTAGDAATAVLAAVPPTVGTDAVAAAAVGAVGAAAVGPDATARDAATGGDAADPPTAVFAAPTGESPDAADGAVRRRRVTWIAAAAAAAVVAGTAGVLALGAATDEPADPAPVTEPSPASPAPGASTPPAEEETVTEQDITPADRAPAPPGSPAPSAPAEDAMDEDADEPADAPAEEAEEPPASPEPTEQAEQEDTGTGDTGDGDTGTGDSDTGAEDGTVEAPVAPDPAETAAPLEDVVPSPVPTPAG